MLYYNRTDVCQATDVNKINKSSKCIINNYYNFLKVNFRFPSKIFNGCHDLRHLKEIS